MTRRPDTRGGSAGKGRSTTADDGSSAGTGRSTNGTGSTIADGRSTDCGGSIADGRSTDCGGSIADGRSTDGGSNTADGSGTPAAAALLLLSLGALAALFAVRRFPVADLLVYRAEGAAVVNGGDLYGFTVTAWDLPATYPPFAALLFVPTVWLSPAVAKAAFVAGNAALAAFLVHLSLRLADGLPGGSGSGLRPGRWSRRAVVLAATAAALWLEPVFQTLVFGQINLLLVCLVLWDLGRPDGARGKGLAIGIATGIKLTPAVFAVHLLLTGRVRAGLTALAGFAGTVAAGALVLPSASWEFFTHRVFETARVGKVWIVDNQSLQGLIARVAHTSEPGVLWLVPAAALGVAGLALARRLHVRHGQAAWAVMAAAFTALLVSPISWSHHWVWCVPLLALLAAERARSGAGLGAVAAVAAVFAARTLWLVPKRGAADLRLEWWLQPFASPYALLTLGLLATAALRCYSVSLSGAASGWAVSRSWESTMR